MCVYVCVSGYPFLFAPRFYRTFCTLPIFFHFDGQLGTNTMI